MLLHLVLHCNLLTRFNKEGIIGKTYFSKNLPCPLVAKGGKERENMAKENPGTNLGDTDAECA
jgi:hypothetical protein